MPVDRPDFRDLVCFSFYQGWRHIQALYRQSFPAGVTPQRAYLLCACDPARPVSVASLVQALHLDAAAMSGLLGRMQAESLLERSVNPTDRREVLVTLTEAGVLLRKECLEALRGADQMLHDVIESRDLSGLMAVVSRLAELADE